ncbi:porin [Microvirga sp. 2TAF3]|uniref:porin n=1 Tax=Microvirga sp. 2TAF3 TaxID=3233014 RepID=UPI003F992203
MKRRLFALAFSSLALPGPAIAAQPSACPPGFSALQGSDTCVRVSGRMRAESVIGSARTRGSNAFQSGASGRVQLDVRKQTEYGPLRAVIRAEGQR